MESKYILLFFDTLYANLVFNVDKEFLMIVMDNFGYNKIFILLASLAGLFVAYAIDYMLGILGFMIYSKINFGVATKLRYTELAKNLDRYYYILLLSIIPIFGKLILFTAGFARLKLYKTFLPAIFVKLAYYLYILCS